MPTCTITETCCKMVITLLTTILVFATLPSDSNKTNLPRFKNIICKTSDEMFNARLQDENTNSLCSAAK